MGGLSASDTSAESISLNASSSAGTYYYGACVESVSGESDTNNNCSDAVSVTVSSSVSSGGETVTIPDANLRAVITDSLGKSRNASITRAEMASLTRLGAPSKGIRSLTGLEHATNLTVLSLNWNDISDISALSNLTNLTVLRLHQNYGNFSISVLSNLTNLTELSLGGNRISDISALSNLTNLTELSLGGNRISDISVLSNLTNLTTLTLWDNSISDISALSNLTNLTALRLQDNNISDISPLVANTGLGAGDTVNLKSNPLSSASINTHIPALQRRGVTVEFDSSSSGGGGNTGDLGTCRAGLVVKPDESCDYKNGTFFVNPSGTGIIVSGGLVMTAGNSHNQRGIINGVRWNFHASKNSGSNSWTIHTAR